MGVSQDHWFVKLLSSALILFRGNTDFRFASLLVRAGTFIACPGLVVLTVTRAFDLLGGKDSVADGLSIAGFVVGVLLIFIGILLFVVRSKSVQLPDAAVYSPDESTTFEDVARYFAQQQSKALVFSGFSSSDRRQRLRPGRIEAPDGITLLRGLSTNVHDPDAFPAYDVIEGPTDITLRIKP